MKMTKFEKETKNNLAILFVIQVRENSYLNKFKYVTVREQKAIK